MFLHVTDLRIEACTRPANQIRSAFPANQSFLVTHIQPPVLNPDRPEKNPGMVGWWAVSGHQRPSDRQTIEMGGVGLQSRHIVQTKSVLGES